MKIVSLFSVVEAITFQLLFWRSTSQPFYFGTGEGSIEHFTRFRPFTRFRSSLSIASGYIINNFYDSQKTWSTVPTKPC
jgi:4-hydroxybenzoate polyprenyltransferase